MSGKHQQERREAEMLETFAPRAEAAMTASRTMSLSDIPRDKARKRRCGKQKGTEEDGLARTDGYCTHCLQKLHPGIASDIDLRSFFILSRVAFSTIELYLSLYGLNRIFSIEFQSVSFTLHYRYIETARSVDYFTTYCIVHNQ